MSADLHVPPAVPYKSAMAMLDEPSAINKLTLTVRVLKDLPHVMAKLGLLCVSELHLTIDERRDDDRELMQLYQATKRCALGNLPLRACSITYRASNDDSRNNPVRLMTVLNLLNQLNWAQCTKVDLALNVNYIESDPRLELLDELPMNVMLRGKTCPSEDADDDAKLAVLAKAYPYLEGVL